MHTTQKNSMSNLGSLVQRIRRQESVNSAYEVMLEVFFVFVSKSTEKYKHAADKK